MRVVFCASALLVVLASTVAHADSLIRVKCDEKDEGAQVYINGRLKGTCPVDVPAPAGTVQLQARKPVNNDYEQTFSRQLLVIDGVPQKIELVMGAPQLTADAKRRQEAAEASKQLRAANTGDVAAMRKVAEYLDVGFGIQQSAAQAKLWRDKAEAATTQEKLSQAQAGDAQAMVDLAARYDAGLGVRKDPEKARTWRAKAVIAQREQEAKDKENARIQAAQEAARLKQQKIDEISFVKTIKQTLDDKNLPSTLVTTFLPYATSFDLTTAPTRTAELAALKNQAALRPSTWGKPDSMMARASTRYKANTEELGSEPVLVAAQ